MFTLRHVQEVLLVWTIMWFMSATGGHSVGISTSSITNGERSGRLIINSTSTASRNPWQASCGGVFVATEFKLLSSNFPLDYPNGVNCSYRVIRHASDICGLELNFVSFDVEPSDNCSYDFLEVNGIKLCGKISSGAVRLFMFSENEILLHFVSDKQNARSGFHIKVRQVTLCNPKQTAPSVSCNKVFDQREFHLKSPNHPGNYSHGQDCAYVIRRKSPKVCALRLTFNSFNMEMSTECKNDFFIVDEMKYCGKLEDGKLRTFPFQTQDKVLSFHSDSSVSGPGFNIHVLQEECDPRAPAIRQEECSTEIRETDFEIKSPGYPDMYMDSVRCEYTVRRTDPSICDLVVTIMDFKLQEGEVCENDYLQIAEERLCGNIESGMIRTYPFNGDDDLILSFETDDQISDKGFHISGQQRSCNESSVESSPNATTIRKVQPVWTMASCDRTITEPEDVIRSPGYPDPYPENADCRFMVRRAESKYCELEIIIDSLHIQVGESCQFDFLEVDGHRFCGSTTAGNKRIFNFKRDEIFIHFHSDSSSNDRGFQVTLRQRDCAPTSTIPTTTCDQVFDTQRFIITSPNYPQEYDNGVDCRYVIRRSHDEVCKLEMQLVRFDVESSSGCEYDYLDINNEKICGVMDNTTRTYIFQDYEKVLTFHSDSGTSRTGFSIRVQQVECSSKTTDTPLVPSKPCDQRFDIMAFEIRSDNHPNNYDPHSRCVYTVVQSHPGVCSLELTFMNFDVEASDGCQYDYLEVDGEKLCGVYPANLKRTIPFEGPELTLEFRSDGATSRPGFHIRIQQVDCSTSPGRPSLSPDGCGVTFTNSSGTIQSPGFPAMYPPSQNCTYRFIAEAGQCRILFQFLEFSLHTKDALCEQDYLLVNGIKYCGPQLLGQKRTITFYGSPREVNVTFESDDSIADKGFYAIFRQLPCSPALGRFPGQSKSISGQARATCDRLYASLTFNVISPGHPENYPSDADCRYTIRRLSTRICKFRLIFRSFDVESSENCEYDYLEVEGRKLCGTMAAEEMMMIDAKDYQTIFKFHSDSANTRPGFTIKVEQMECDQEQPQRQEPQNQKTFPPQRQEPHNQKNFPPQRQESQHQKNFQPQRQEPQYQNNFPPQRQEPQHQNNFPPQRQEPQHQNNFPPQRQGPQHQNNFPSRPQEPVVARPLDDEPPPIFYPPHHDYEHLFDYPTYEGTALQRTLQVGYNHQNCDRTFDQEEFEIRSVNFPINYPNGVNCRYLILRAHPDICWVKLLFLRFDLEDSEHCHFDYLSINSKRICGTLPEDEIRAYIFNSDEISMYFRSDGATSHRGFLIKGEQLRCKPGGQLPPPPPGKHHGPPNRDHIPPKMDQGPPRRDQTPSKKEPIPSVKGQVAINVTSPCDQSFEKEIFVIQSPNYPSSYPEGSDCRLKITKANRYICGLQLTLLSFDIENHPSCDRDYLQINGDKLCGPIPSRTIRKIAFPTTEMTMTFHSNDKVSRPGFSILVHQTEDCEELHRSASSTGEACQQNFSSSSFILASPQFPEEYPAGATCEYKIKKSFPGVCKLELRIITFDLEESSDGRCDNDYLELQAGYKLCGKLPKDNTENVFFNNDELVLRFRSNDVTQRPGFSIQVHQITDCGLVATPGTPIGSGSPCGGNFSTEEFSIKSPNFPDDYPHDSNCKYEVQKSSESVCGLELKFAHFDVEKGPECSYDYLDIGYKTICGHLPTGFSRIVPFETSAMTFTFRSDKGTSRSGFAIRVKQLSDCGTTWKPATPPSRMCDHCLKESRGHLISPDYPDDYAADLKCEYTIQRGKGFCGLEIFFHDFHLDDDTPGCKDDALIVAEQRYCGAQLKDKIKKLNFPIGDSNEVSIRLETDSKGSASGFHAEYRQIPCRGYPWKEGQQEWKPSNASLWAPPA